MIIIIAKKLKIITVKQAYGKNTNISHSGVPYYSMSERMSLFVYTPTGLMLVDTAMLDDYDDDSSYKLFWGFNTKKGIQYVPVVKAAQHHSDSKHPPVHQDQVEGSVDKSYNVDSKSCSSSCKIVTSSSHKKRTGKGKGNEHCTVHVTINNSNSTPQSDQQQSNSSSFTERRLPSFSTGSKMYNTMTPTQDVSQIGSSSHKSQLEAVAKIFSPSPKNTSSNSTSTQPMVVLRPMPSSGYLATGDKVYMPPYTGIPGMPYAAFPHN